MNASCWQCGAAVFGAFFCPSCDTLQKPSHDYFSIFGLERKLSLDNAALQQRYYELTRRLHPDRFTRRSQRERDYSLEISSVLNDAYRVLRDPVARAEYVLKQEGLDLSGQRSKDVPQELLEEVFELNMALEELRQGDAQARERLEQAGEKFRQIRREIDAQLEQLFSQFDQGGGRKTLEKIRSVLNRRRYIQNLVVEVEKELAGANALT